MIYLFMRIYTHDSPDVYDVAALTAALSDVNRLRILNLLLQASELCVCDIERVLGVPQTRVSRHLAILRNSGWVAARRSGRWMHYRLTADTPMKQDLAELFRRHWSGTLEFMQDIDRLRNPSPVCCETESCGENGKTK